MILSFLPNRPIKLFLSLQSFYQLNLMKTFAKNSLPVYSPNSSTSDTTPSLQDSKSAANLYQNVEQTKKFRQTTYFPATTKNTNRQFLRYTVNLNKSDKQAISTHANPLQGLRLKRKFTIQDAPKVMIGHESPNLNSKPNSTQKKCEKKNFNPQKKQDSNYKHSPLPKFLQKKHEVAENMQQSPNKTERINMNISPINSNNKKQIFTPKCTKNKQDQISINKITTSFSSADLLKQNHSLSPTCQSITSRVIDRQKIVNSAKIDDFKKVKFLGQGKFGLVHLVLHKQTNTIYALKQIKKDSIAKNNMQQQLLMQIKMQFFINHPNILKLYGIFNDQQNVYLILEYMEQGTLYSQLRKKKMLKEADASKKLRDVLDAVNCLHQQMIAHRDIKPQNIVVSYDVCKLCDLGWAAICQDRRKTLCGTIDYASPELLQGKEYSLAIDLWCLGVLSYELTVGKCPFYHISRKQTMKKIINADLSDIHLPPSMPNQAKDFIMKFLRKNPEQRMSAESALFHPFIKKYYDQDLQDIRHIQKKKN